MKERIRRLSGYARNFIRNEEGMEFLQFAIIVVVTVALIGVVTVLKNVIENNIQQASDEANEQMGGLLSGS